jgi:nucleoid-associated protein YgaU
MKKQIMLFVLAALIFVSCASAPRKVSVLEVTKSEKIVRAAAQKEVENNPPGDLNTYYTVKKGDTLWKISKTVCGKGSYWENIAALNALKVNAVLRAGMKLKTTNVCGPAEDKGNTKNAVKKVFTYRVTENKAFGAGEKLTFGIKYFGVTAGIAVLEVKGIEKYNDRQVYHIDATARTAPFFETFYRVKDVISTYMDVMGLFSWKYSKKLEEGGYRNTTIMEFNHEQSYAVKKNGDKCDIVPFVQDVLSEFYYFRSIYKGENEVRIDVASDECKTYQIVVKKLRNEKITTDAGEFDCIVVQPFLKYEGIFRQKGDVWLWLTNDKNLMPVQIKSQIAIGTIDVILQEAVVVKAE